MKRLTAPTEDFAKGEATRLAADATAGSNVTITLESNDGLSNAAFIAIGHEGNELCELAQINQAISGNTQVRVATLKFNHVAGEPVRLYRYDKRKFYGAISASGSYTQLTGDGSPKLIEVDDPMGTSLEYSGSTYTYFKATYYNSQTDTETDQADAVAVAGDETIRYATIYAIRKHAGLAGNPRYSDSRLEDKRRQAENEIKSTIGSLYALPLSYVPPLISRVCELLAAGYIDYEEFGSEGQGTKWLGEARGILKAIKDGKQLLLDADDAELERVSGVNQLSGYPNDVCEDEARGTMDQTF
jgi:phage gp36-like protein